ncbi:hypothetical protein T440DRAFT_466964 [Plenodomus tracheiphilus IPT5]|uniref:RING-CH-type domain-containing protein n=1 Tax=Plenodomus tracheiphilus IPT5 TaxID=1408161 RepID=A0A6A7B9P7_9PLEO|nr:hypothetical protein T440DRAFT_466964 [Plenodomus tracheiphilus IPT5]
MASLPPQRPASQRRASPPAEASSAQQEHVARTNSFSAQSVDSQTLLLNSPPSEHATPAREAQKEAPAQHTSALPVEEEDIKKCWICFNDETEDDETTSEWRSPCSCSLVAHEKCLLDWIADMEAPSSRRRTGTRASKVLCPQCKSEIVIARPKSYVVEAVRSVERFTGSLLLPGFALVTGTALYSTLTLSGTHTIYQIFGTEDALQILGPLYETPNPMIGSVAIRLLQHLRQHWRLDLGLPLIPTVLVASRTTFADSFLPFLPLIFFVSSGQPGDDMMQLRWPPSAAFSFAALPYLRGFYNAYYDRVWLPRVQKWFKEIQPRAGEDATADAEQFDHDHVHDHEHHHFHDGEIINDVEIEVDFDIFADWNNGGNAAPADNNAQPQAHPIDAPPLDDDAVPELIDVEQQHRQQEQNDAAAPAPNIPLQPAAPRRQRARAHNHAYSTHSIADTILGALIFPSIAAAMGELLKKTLPSSWVTPPAGTPAISWLGGWVNTSGRQGKATGFLQTRWGRSIVGGCLFVGFKDAVLLYVRWKIAQNHRRRKIVDFDRKKGGIRGGVAGS